MSANRNHREVVGTGFTVLDRIYADGEFAAEALGGSCGNVLVSLAMLDRDVAPVLALGRDEVGRRLVDEFQVAGADISYIALRADRGSPVLAQELDTATGEHRFSFTCLETSAAFPAYEPVGVDELRPAGRAIETCRVFYADRISDEIVAAMESARSAGALVYFEPSDANDEELFRRAVSASSILKYSSERLGAQIAAMTVGHAISIVTHGEAGLEMRQDGEVRWCAAIPAERVADTCGSGDMVSVGVIDWMLSHLHHAEQGMTLGTIVEGVLAGQRLAAANCAYAGARGLFHERGASHARRILSQT
jgi:fructokinase